ncbi:MAG: TldD/PmbA family protein [Planctomycetes bacterium]|nr:TldD/PmbA family protein [Planctomycetota bacterium]
MTKDDPLKKTYLDICCRCVERAVRLGAEWCDASAGAARDISVAVEKTGIKTADAGQGEDAAIRVFVRGGMGYASVSGSARRDIDRAVERAVALAGEATPDPDFRALPPPQPAPEVEGLYDDRIAGMGVEDVVRIAAANIQAARAMEPDVNLSGHVGLAVGEGALASSTGVAVAARGTEIDADLEALLKRGQDKGYFYDFDFGRNLADTAPEKVAESAILGARRFLGARRIHSGRMTLILGPLAAYGFIGGLVGAANAESIQRGRSYLCGKLGEIIASEHLTVVDDGLVPRGMRSGAHDGEGTRRRPLTIIERGRLVSLLHNSYTAGKAGAESTGHGTHSGGIAATNLRPALGARPAAELVREVKEGIYLESGEIRPDPASGDISASIDFGFYVKDGCIQFPVESAMLGANILELLPRLDAVSSDAREEPGILMPTLRFQDVQIAGTE